MAAGAAVATAAGGLLGAIGQRAQNKAQEAQLRQDALSKRDQASEILNRAKMNAEFLRTSARSFQARQRGAFAKGGVDVGTGTPLLAMENTMAQTMNRIADESLAAEYQSRILNQAADNDVAAAEDVRDVRDLQFFGSLLGTAGQTASLSRGIKGQGQTVVPKKNPKPSKNFALNYRPPSNERYA